MGVKEAFVQDPLEFCGAVTSILTFIFDLVTDLLVALFYLFHGHLSWGCLTLGLIILPGECPNFSGHISCESIKHIFSANFTKTFSVFYIENAIFV